MISIIIPTIDGREDHFKRAVAAYETRTTHPYEIIIERNHPAVGPAWNAGAARAAGDCIHFTADDLEPHDGWDTAAMETLATGALPAPRITNQHGQLDSCGLHGVEMEDGAHVAMSVIPFMPVQVWESIRPVLPIHYFTDNWISWCANRIGWPARVNRRFRFTHHWAQWGRGAGMTQNERMEHDQAVYLDAVAKRKASHGD